MTAKSNSDVAILVWEKKRKVSRNWKHQGERAKRRQAERERKRSLHDARVHHRRTRFEAKSFPQGYRRHFRDYVRPVRGRSRSENHEALSARCIIFAPECPIGAAGTDEKFALCNFGNWFCSVSPIAIIFVIWANSRPCVYVCYF